MPLFNPPTVISSENPPTNAARPVTEVGTTAETFEPNGNGFSIYNSSAVTIYLAYGPTPVITSSAYSVPIVAGGYYEDPFNFDGICQLIAASGTTNVIQLTVLS